MRGLKTLPSGSTYKTNHPHVWRQAMGIDLETHGDFQTGFPAAERTLFDFMSLLNSYQVRKSGLTLRGSVAAADVGGRSSSSAEQGMMTALNSVVHALRTFTGDTTPSGLGSVPVPRIRFSRRELTQPDLPPTGGPALPALADVAESERSELKHEARAYS